MNQLIQELIFPFLTEDKIQKGTALIPGKYKPPHKGHLEVVKKLSEDPRIKNIVILISPKTVEGITPELSKEIWEKYLQKYGIKAKILLSNEPSPVKAAVNIVKNNPDNFYYVVTGYRTEEDLKDLARGNFTAKYGNADTIVVEGEDIRAIRIRQYLVDRDYFAFSLNLPDRLTNAEKQQIYDRLIEVVPVSIRETQLDNKEQFSINDTVKVSKGTKLYDKKTGKRITLKQSKIYKVTSNNNSKFNLEDPKGNKFWIMDYEIKNNPEAWVLIEENVIYKKNISNLQLEGLSSKEKDIVDDILGEVNKLQEIDLNKVKEKLKYYGRKGLLTLSILLSVANSLQANPGIAKDVMDIGIEMINPDQQTDFYSAVLGYTQELLNSAMEKGDIDMVDTLKEVKLHYETLKNNKTPKPLSNKAEKVAQIILKSLSKTDNIAYYVNYGSSIKTIKEDDPKVGTGKKPKGSGRRLYTDEDPKDTVGIKFRTKEDIVNTLNKKSFLNKSHQRQSQIINLIHQRVRAAYDRAKDPDTKSRLKRGLDYIEKKKEASKEKTKRLQTQKKKSNENIVPNHDGKAIPYGSGYKKLDETKLQNLIEKLKNNWKDFTTAIKQEGKETQEAFVLLNQAAQGKITLTPEQKKQIGDQMKDVLKTLGYLTILTLPGGSIVTILLKVLNLNRYVLPTSFLKEENKKFDKLEYYKEYYKNISPSNFNVEINKDKIEILGIQDKISLKESPTLAWNPKESLVTLSEYLMNELDIKETPNIEIKEDEENAKDILGKTAYYNPSTYTITLYITGRHPKDILRSFSHEMIHHKQNLDGRLENITTTNTNEDDELTELEREAYELGNILFRKWEDKIKND